MKNHPSPRPHTFQQFNAEINDFYKSLKDNNFTDAEIRKIFAPLAPPSSTTKHLALLLAPIALLTLLYLLTYIDPISWHFSALGRILLIKLLPLWDWTALKNAKCLIDKPSPPPADPRFNCDLCETLHEIDVYDTISTDLLKKRYLDVHVPVIIKQSFPKFDSFIDDLVAAPDIANSKPCGLSTNIHNDVPPVKDLLGRTELFDSFFLHFQNCDFRAMKQFRAFAPRPRFVPPELSPVQFNWLLWSRNYNVSQFKEIGLVEKVTVVGQVFGGNFVRLVPRKNCADECPVIDVKLGEGESLVFTSLWNLEYRPAIGENVAVILEMH
ncbi:hypothetical protein Zmor_016733 [Zophobas morio]|uniref:Uncharacterized protein n=1 Tax=Zophobas morio TaxID=2755281 RepID=A0AA38MC62_9CUCU|nr:hypothetical protein Zmor_016733 [Zophobas morio]